MKPQKKISNSKSWEFHEGYLREEQQLMNPGPVERMEQELVSLYTIPAAYVRDWWFVKRSQMGSLLNRDHWRYTFFEREGAVQRVKTRIRILLDWPLKEE